MATCLPAEAITTHRGTFAPMCRQVFGLVDVDLAIRLLALASQPQWASACECVRFHFTAAGQFRIPTGFPFKPDRCHFRSSTDRPNIYGAKAGVNTTYCAGSATLMCALRLIHFSPICPKNRSTRLSQDSKVGVKCTWSRGRPAKHARTFPVLCVPSLSMIRWRSRSDSPPAVRPTYCYAVLAASLPGRSRRKPRFRRGQLPRTPCVGERSRDRTAPASHWPRLPSLRNKDMHFGCGSSRPRCVSTTSQSDYGALPVALHGQRPDYQGLVSNVLRNCRALAII